MSRRSPRHSEERFDLDMNEDEEPRTALFDDLKGLDQEYRELSIREEALVAILQRLQEEETALHLALRDAAETGEQRMQQTLREKDEAAIARLEQALMESSSDDENANTADVLSVFSFPKFSGGSTVTNDRGDSAAGCSRKVP